MSLLLAASAKNHTPYCTAWTSSEKVEILAFGNILCRRFCSQYWTVVCQFGVISPGLLYASYKWRRDETSKYSKKTISIKSLLISIGGYLETWALLRRIWWLPQLYHVYLQNILLISNGPLQYISSIQGRDPDLCQICPCG